ncbi:MAG: BCCT family transporter [Actinomycetaceae bacterium]|nr:BCCT family transporter [Arcanobacterium sp.]MDD7504613.1 BCCT family transporter [Actinomycetaceae bacterium]MDY6143071.1 BCCT family transporter [Arcanobacterium sp.]
MSTTGNNLNSQSEPQKPSLEQTASKVGGTQGLGSARAASTPGGESPLRARRQAIRQEVRREVRKGIARTPLGRFIKPSVAEALKPPSLYPHDIHPALVPGVSIEDQKVRYGIDPFILIPVGAAIIAFVVWGVLAPAQVMDVSTVALNWVMSNLGWIFNTLAVALPIFLLVVAFSRYGHIPLGLDSDTPQYSTKSWTAMLFGAGIGIGIIFFGTLEPMSYYLSPLPGTYDPATEAAVKGALAQSAVHWGASAWAFYAVVGLTVGYASFRKGRVPLMSSILFPLFGTSPQHWSSRLIDGLAILATLFGTAASLGIGALQIAHGYELVSGWGTGGNTAAIIVIAILTAAAIASATSGVAKGIRMLSDVNLYLAVALAVFFFVAGPTAFLMNILPGVFMEYARLIPTALGATMSDGEAVKAFLSGWTTFYWAWWVSWAPFVGVFVAKISRGRSIKQFILGVMLIPSTIVVIAFTVLGGTGIWFQRSAGDIVPGNDIANMPPQEDMFFEVLGHLPAAQFIAPLVMILLAIFFITSADSASLVNSQLSQGGNPEPKKVVTAFWALLMAGIAVVMLLMGGPSALSGLQNLVTITALPFSIVLVLMCVAIWLELRRDPMMIRRGFGVKAMQNAVRQGIEEHGDNFELAVLPAEGSDRAAGAEFDSTNGKYVDWYRRTDEDGNEIPYDYELGAYIDPKTGEPIIDDDAPSEQ